MNSSLVVALQAGNGELVVLHHFPFPYHPYLQGLRDIQNVGLNRVDLTTAHRQLLVQQV